jgi:hypothetical protein
MICGRLLYGWVVLLQRWDWYYLRKKRKQECYNRFVLRWFLFHDRQGGNTVIKGIQ